MKIIAHQTEGYLCSVTEAEIATLLGFRSPYDDDFKKWRADKNRGRESLLPTGTEITVSAIGDFWRTVLWKEEEAKKGAEAMRALASLITNTLPSGLIVPKAIVEVHGET